MFIESKYSKININNLMEIPAPNELHSNHSCRAADSELSKETVKDLKNVAQRCSEDGPSCPKTTHELKEFSLLHKAE